MIDYRKQDASSIDSTESRDWIQTVTSDTFDALVLEASEPIVVEFMSYGCAHCRSMEPILQQIAAADHATVTIYRVNIAVEQDFANSLSILGTPTLIMYLNGAEVARFEGPSPSLDGIQNLIAQSFGSQDYI